MGTRRTDLEKKFRNSAYTYLVGQSETATRVEARSQAGSSIKWGFNSMAVDKCIPIVHVARPAGWIGPFILQPAAATAGHVHLQGGNDATRRGGKTDDIEMGRRPGGRGRQAGAFMLP